MQAERSRISLVFRTIGAARGRAARGRPVQGSQFAQSSPSVAQVPHDRTFPQAYFKP